MKVREFDLSDAPDYLRNEASAWSRGADHGYAEACKDHQELVDALEQIASLDPSLHSSEGFNEWGEADCFNQAQKIASAVLAKYKGE